MFGKSSSEKNVAAEQVLNTIGRGTVIVGKIVTKGDLRVEGRIVGTLSCEQRLVVGKHGMIEGSVEARNAYVEGEIQGTVLVRELLQLQETARVQGDIYTQKLSVQIGATFTGSCRMGAIPKDKLALIQEQADQATQQGLMQLQQAANGSGTAENVLKHEKQAESPA